MATGDTYEVLREAIIRNDEDEVWRILNGDAGIDTMKKRGDKEKLMNIAIKNADKNVLLALFQSDSRFPIDHRKLVDEEKLKELQKLISEDKDLSDFFKERDGIHESIKRGDMGAVKSLICNLKMDSSQKKYFVNSNGESLLYTAIKNGAYNAWANLLLDLGMCYATKKEKEEEEGNEGMCERATSKLLIPLEDCHLQKLLSISAVPPSAGPAMEIVSQYYNYLNAFEITRTLMEVVQDMPGLQIVFDLERTSIERLRPCSSDEHQGIEDFDLLKICVTAKKDDYNGLPEISSNLAHELCHLAMEVVYVNNGLPYRKGDAEREGEYKEVMDKIIGSKSCHEIVCKVWELYPKGQQGKELIVRVPELFAFYNIKEPISSSILNAQEKALLSFYENYVQPDLRLYIDSIHSSGRILCRSLMNYMRLLSPVERIKVNEDIGNPIIGKHNHLYVLRTSNIKMAQSHLESFFKKEGMDEPYFCDWSLYEKIRANTIEGSDAIIKFLKTREIKTLVITWDKDKIPKFCKKQGCAGDCQGCYFRDYTDCVYLLVSTKWNVLKNIEPNNYSWDDLSTCTKLMTQDRKVRYNGKLAKLKTLFSDAGGEEYFEEFMSECLDSEDISFLLGEEVIELGKTYSLMDDRVENKVLKHPGVFIPRYLTQNVVNVNADMLRKFQNDVFFVSNVTLSYLCNSGISESDIRQWDVRTNNGTARCYVLNQLPDGKDEKSVFLEVVEHLRGLPDVHVKMLHHLKFKRGFFAHIKSLNIKADTDNYLHKLEGLISRTTKRKLGPSDFQCTDPLLIADDPGTGKTTFFHSLPKIIKESNPEKWVSIVDLSLQSHQEHLNKLEAKKPFSEEEALDSLFVMVGSGRSSTLERNIFDDFCKRKSKVFVIFDGFDEICPNHKLVATNLIVAVREINGNNIKVAVSTRLHERTDLEEALGVISFQLVHFSENDQVCFLNEYWNQLMNRLPLLEWQGKMKSSMASFEKWEIGERGGGVGELISEMEDMLKKGKSVEKGKNKLNFTPVVRKVQREPLVKGMDSFLETPLHVQMFAMLFFEDSFTMRHLVNLGQLYQRFFHLKVKIYNHEKARSSGNVQSEKMFLIFEEKISETLEIFSHKLLEVGISCEITGEEMREACDVGLVSQKGEYYQFIHRTFAEFFFARYLLKNAGESDVTKLWLHKLFVEDEFERVRKFIEDILQLLSGESTDSYRAEDISMPNLGQSILYSRKPPLSNCLMIKQVNLDHSVLDDPSELTIPIYRIVHECSVHILQYFADSFEKDVANVLIEDVHMENFKSMAAIRTSYRDMGENCLAENYNSFIFAAFCSLRESTHYAKIVKKMLNLLKKYDMFYEIKKLLLSKGINGLFPIPPAYYGDVRDYSDGRMMYIEEVLIFLVEHKEIFGDILRGWMTLKSKQHTESSETFFQRIFVLNLNLLFLVINALYNETQLKNILEKYGVISNVLINITEKYNLCETQKVWNLIKKGLGTDVCHLQNYLLWKDECECNALFKSAYNEDHGVVEFIWQLAGELMGDEKKKEWLFDSFNSGIKMKYKRMYLGWSFHKFLVRLLNCAFLSGDELVCLLKSKNHNKDFYILRDYAFGFYNHLMPIDRRINIRPLLEAIGDSDLFYHLQNWLKHNSSLPLNEDLKNEVDKLFEEVRHGDRYGLVEKLQVDECEFLVGIEFKGCKIHQDRFRFFVAAFFKQVHFCRDHFTGVRLINCLMKPKEFNYSEHSILHVIVHSLPSLCLGYVCSVLIQNLSLGHFLSFLLKKNEDGSYILHRWNEDGRHTHLDKFDQITRAVFGESLVSIMNLISDYTCHFYFRKVGMDYIFNLGTSKNENEMCLMINRLLYKENANFDDGVVVWPFAELSACVWVETVLFSGIECLRQVWDIIKRSFRGDSTQTQHYLLWKYTGNANALFLSAYNEDPEVIEFIWELGGELMDDQERRKWLFDSFECGINMKYKRMYLGWSFHMFLVRLVNCAFLSDNEMVRLLTSKEDEEGYCILQGYPYCLFTHILPINHRMNIRTLVETMYDLDFFYQVDNWLDHNSSLPLNKDLKNEVEKLFEEVRSADRYGLADQLQVDEGGFLVGIEFMGNMIHQDRFRFFVVAFFKQVHFCRDHFNEDGLLKCLMKPEKFQVKERNVIDVVAFSMPRLCLGYVCSVLVQTLSLGHFLSILGKIIKDRDNILRNWKNKDYCTILDKLNEITKKIFGENSVSFVNTISQNIYLFFNHASFPKKMRQSGAIFHQIVDLKEDFKRLDIMRLLCEEKVKLNDFGEEGPTLITKLWMDTVACYRVLVIRNVWFIIKESSGDNSSKLRNFLLLSENNKFHALLCSAYNEDPEAIEFIWELAAEFMDEQEKKYCLFDSFDSIQGFLIPKDIFLGWSFHKFLARLMDCCFLSGDEMHRLLKSKDNEGERYILRGYPFGFFNHVLPINYPITPESFNKDIGNYFNFYYLFVSCLNVNSSLPLNEDLKNEVDKIFQEVKSHDRHGLADQLRMDKRGFLVGTESERRKIHQDRFKFFVVAFFKQVHFLRDHFEGDELIGFFKVPEKCGNPGMEPNVLHMMSSLYLGYVLSILIESLSRDNFLGLLFEPNRDGNTLFHITVKFYSVDSGYGIWNKLNDVLWALLGKDASSASPNEKFTRHRKPRSEEALEEIVSEWKRVWTLQKEEEGSEMTLHQVTDEGEMGQNPQKNKSKSKCGIT